MNLDGKKPLKALSSEKSTRLTWADEKFLPGSGFKTLGLATFTTVMSIMPPCSQHRQVTVDILRSFFDHLLNKDLIFHITITLKRVFIAFSIAMILGVFLGIIMGFFPKVDSFLDIFLIIGLTNLGNLMNFDF